MTTSTKDLIDELTHESIHIRDGLCDDEFHSELLTKAAQRLRELQEVLEALEREKQVSAMEYLALEGQCREHLEKIEALRKAWLIEFEQGGYDQEDLAEVDALRKDAERYQWLRSRDLDTVLDIAIDAAIKGEQA
jgi:hypothetical protein